jgi:hypothetical protein
MILAFATNALLLTPNAHALALTSSITKATLHFAFMQHRPYMQQAHRAIFRSKATRVASEVMDRLLTAAATFSIPWDAADPIATS